jgi:cytochrome P450 family 135
MAGSGGTPSAGPAAATLPLGPSASPAVQTVAFHRDPLGVLRRSRSRYGPLFTLRLAVVGPVVVVADAAMVEPLLAADPAGARAGEARRRILPMASPRSVFGADGEQHRMARERIWAAFNGESVGRHSAAMESLTEDHVARWPRGRPFRLLPRVRTLIDEIFVRHIVGVDERERGRALVLAMRRMLWTPGNPPMPIPGPGNDTLPGPASVLFKWRSAPVIKLVGDAIDRRRGAAADGRVDDIIGALLHLAPDLPTPAMVDELLAVLMAGQEPPSVAVTRVLDRLARYPAVRDRFLAAGAGDPYRDAVVREELRLHPPALAVLRRLTTALDVAGQSLPADTTVMLPVPLLHRDPQAFDAPDEFRPERWLQDAPPEQCFLPFGGGVRRCLGEHLARAYFAAVVPTVLRGVTLRPLRPRPERMVVRAATLVPHRSALVTAS